MATFFADTYAIVELLKGSPAYRQYKTAVLVTTEFNHCEFAYAITRDFLGYCRGDLFAGPAQHAAVPSR